MNEALDALNKLGDSSTLDDIERNRLETMIRAALSHTAQAEKTGAERHYETLATLKAVMNTAQAGTEGENYAGAGWALLRLYKSSAANNPGNRRVDDDYACVRRALTQAPAKVKGTGNPASAPLICRTEDEDGHKVVILAEWFYDEMVARLDREQAPAEWRPISEAPRDGTEILVASTLRQLGKPDCISVVCNARWIETDDGCELWHDIEGHMGQENVEMWALMPLPAAPAPSDEGAGG